MKARGLILLGLSLLLGFAAIVWVKKPAASGNNMASVVVAKVALNYGDAVKAEKLTIVQMPPASVPQGAFSKIADLVEPKAKEPRIVLRTMAANEVILPGKVSGTGQKAILSTIIDPNMRATTVRVNDVTGGAGFVQPGDHVDVLLTRTKNDDRSNPKADILLQNVKVLGIDQHAADPKEKATIAKAVTLELSPEDAQKTTLAANIGTLSLILRGSADPDAVRPRTLTLSDLVPTQPKKADDPKPAPPPAPPKPPTVEVFRGTDATSYEVRRDGGAPTAVTNQPKGSARPKARTPATDRPQVAEKPSESGSED